MTAEEISQSMYANLTKVQLMTHLHIRDTERAALVSVGLNLKLKVAELEKEIEECEQEMHDWATEM